MRLQTIGVVLCKLSALAFRRQFTAYANYVQCPNVNLDPVIQKGKRYFHSVTGEYFPIKGIAYYPRPNNGSLSISNSVDFFTDDYRELWEADVANLRRLGVNTIRIYAVDPSRNHDDFMCALQEAGIYAIIGLLADCQNCAIGPNEAPSCYPNSLKRRGQLIINEFSKYSNLLLFSAGNEVTLYARNRQFWVNAACQKKFLRDMRWYMDTCSALPSSILPRRIPIGMANWDNEREAQAFYFNCRTDSNDVYENTEWYGLNSYQHCNPKAITVDQLTGWSNLRGDFARFNLPVPVVITEYGCRERFPTIGEFEAQRTWLQVDALYSPLYAATLAGGVVFEYSAEKRIVDTSAQRKPWPYYEFMKLNYGIGYYSPIDCDHVTTPCEYNEYPEFELLRAKLAMVNVSSMSNIDAYVPSGEMPECPAWLPSLSDFVWPVDDEPNLPCYLTPTTPPTLQPSRSVQPSSQPTKFPSSSPSISPSNRPSLTPPSTSPTLVPSARPSTHPSRSPSWNPSFSPSTIPSDIPSSVPSDVPSFLPSMMTSEAPSNAPSMTEEKLKPTPKPTSVLSTIDASGFFSPGPTIAVGGRTSSLVSSSWTVSHHTWISRIGTLALMLFILYP